MITLQLTESQLARCCEIIDKKLSSDTNCDMEDIYLHILFFNEYFKFKRGSDNEK